MPQVIKSSFFLKILFFTALMSFIPFIMQGVYSLVQVYFLSATFTENQIKNTTDNVLNQKFSLLEKEAELINMELLKVEENLKMLQKQAEYLFAGERVRAVSRPDIRLMQSPKGYRWEPFGNPYEAANFFISASARPLPMQDLAKAKELEPLMMQTIRNNPLLKAVFFCFSESGWLIYPAMNADYEVSINKLPPDINVQDYEFYYLADEFHNPERAIKWTNPYSDVTHWERVTTALIPVYLPSGELRGVIGADFPVKFIEDQVLHFRFKEPNAFAFIKDNQGNLLASQRNKLSAALFLDPSLQSRFIRTGENDISELDGKTKGIRKVSTSAGNFYLLYSPISSNGWTLYFVIPESDIVNPVIQDAHHQTSLQMMTYVQRLLFFLLLGSVAVILFSYFFSKTVTGPVKHLTKATQEIARGNYHTPIPVSTQDEIGQLTETFNLMNIKINKLIRELVNRANDLEERVQERTKELQEANEQLTETFERLKKSEIARTEFIVQISHDLKTPLTTIKGYVQLIHEYGFSLEQQKKYMELILFQINHMIQLIHDLFEISSLELHESRFSKEWVPIGFILEHALEIATSKTENEQIRIEYDGSDDLPLVFVDPKKLNRALVNILNNAIKYSSDKEQSIIQIKSFQQDARLIIEITDNGVGIAEENLEKVFTPFFRDPHLHNTNISGSGLGLTIAQKIIEAHDGDIRISSTVGVGTTVTIALPVDEMEWAAGAG